MAKTKIARIQENDVQDVFQLEKNLIGSASAESIKKSLAGETLSYFVLKLDERIIGFYEISIVAPEAELFDIAVSAEFQGRGYGKLLIQDAIERCKEKNVRTIFLEVNSINYKAFALYRKFGFTSYGERKNYYGKNDAILMKLDLD